MEQYKRHAAIGGAVLGVLVLGWAILGSGKDSPVTNKIDLVCVETGKTFRMRSADLNMFPAVNPSTGKRTLLPYTRQDGQQIVLSRYVSLIDEMDLVTLFVDKDSHAITAQPISNP